MDTELQAMMGPSSDADYYRFPDDSILMTFAGRPGRLFKRRSDLVEFLEQAKRVQAEGPKHVMADLLPQKESFAAQAPQLAIEFAEKFGMPREPTADDLNGLDESVRGRRAGGKFVHGDNFPRLLAYIGEAIRRSTGARWEMILAADGTSCEPWLVSPSCSRHELWLHLADEALEWGRTSSYQRVASYHLRNASYG